MALTKEQLTAAKNELEGEIKKLHGEIHTRQQKIAALKVLLGETVTLHPPILPSTMQGLQKVGVVAPAAIITYPDAVKAHLSANPGKLFTVAEITTAVAKARKMEVSRNFTIAISTTCTRLEGKEGISKGTKENVAAYVFTPPKK